MSNPLSGAVGRRGRAVDLDFLGPRSSAAKARFMGYWISLDLLGFSRPNRDLSRGYGRFPRPDNFARPFPQGRGVERAATVLGMRKGRTVHAASLAWFPILSTNCSFKPVLFAPFSRRPGRPACACNRLTQAARRTGTPIRSHSRRQGTRRLKRRRRPRPQAIGAKPDAPTRAFELDLAITNPWCCNQYLK